MPNIQFLSRAFLALSLWMVSLGVHATIVVRMETVLGDIDVELYDEVAPQTVANFLAYMNAGDYDGTFIHRSAPGFVIQGGGFALIDGVGEHIPERDPVVNEFNISNTRGTIAMAKLSGDPDSATSEWFFNLADNSANLDAQNGGFTVFGRVLGDGMDVVDAIAALQIINAGGPFSSLPVVDYEGGDLVEQNYVFINRIQVPSELIVPEELDFGTLGLGLDSEQDLTIRNQGLNPVTLGAVAGMDAVAAPFSILSDACSGQVLAPDASCVIRLGFSPEAIGETSDSFNIPSDDSGNPNRYVQLRGVASLPLQTSPAGELDLGGVVVGESAQETLTLTNHGGIHASVTQVSISGTHAAEFFQEHNCASLGPAESCQVTLTFTPVSIEAKEATLTIQTDYAQQALIEVALVGQGLDQPQPSLGVISRNLDFGDVTLGLTEQRSWTMINGGGADLIVSDYNIEGPDASDFGVTRNCIKTLVPNQQCSETFRFTPLSPGEKSATLIISSNDPENPAAEVTLNGFGRDAGNRVEVTTPAGARVTLLSQLGTQLQEVSAYEAPSGDGLPDGFAFRHGFYQFNLELPEGEERAAVAIAFPAGETPVTYYKYGSTPDNATPHWYEFLWDGETGAVIQDNVVTLYLADGARGDDDLEMNGVIADPGGPGYSLTPATDPGGSGGGGGCVMRVGPVAPGSVLDLWLVAAVVAWFGLRGRVSRVKA